MPPTCFTVGTTHAEIIRSPILRLTKTRRLEKKSHIWTHQTKGHISTSLMSIAHFSSGFFVVISPIRPDSRSLLWTVYVDVSLSWTLKHLSGLQFLRLVTLMNWVVDKLKVYPCIPHKTWGVSSQSKSRTDYGRCTVLHSHDYMELYSISGNWCTQ
jgi:hypothetical protein